MLGQLDVEPTQVELIVRFVGATDEALDEIAERLGTDAVPSVLSTDIVPGDPFRFAEDTRETQR